MQLAILTGLGAPVSLLSQSSTPPPSVSAGVFPVDQVRRGLHGVAYTVFEGTQPEPMNVELLGVLHNAVGPGQDMILARLSGTKPEYTGVVAGMSGSPVYVDGKLLGALAFRIGEFSKEPICGITPIEEMLQVRDQPQPQASTLQLASTAASTLPAGATPVSDTTVIHPIETPLVFSGFGPEAIKLWQERMGSTGLSAVAGIGGSSSGQIAAGTHRAGLRRKRSSGSRRPRDFGNLHGDIRRSQAVAGLRTPDHPVRIDLYAYDQG